LNCSAAIHDEACLHRGRITDVVRPGGPGGAGARLAAGEERPARGDGTASTTSSDDQPGHEALRQPQPDADGRLVRKGLRDM